MWSLSDIYVKLSYSDREYFLPLFWCFWSQTVAWFAILRQTLFSSCRQKHHEGKKRCFWLADRNEPMQFGYSARISISWVSPTQAWISCFFCHVIFVNCGRIGFKRFLMDPSRKGCSRRIHLLFILMHCHCQIMYVHVAPRKSIHFREIFDWAFTDGLTTFVNMWLCSRQALNFCPITFYHL